MTHLPLKQLCERANQGLYGYGLEYSEANQSYEIAPLLKDGSLDWDNEVAMTAGGDECAHANAQIIVRLTPKNLLVVYAALQSCRSDGGTPNCGYNDSMSFDEEKVKLALSLLDGQTNPHSA